MILARVITLLTDFGLKDPYVGVMKGVIKRINPDVEIIDLSHEVPKYDIDTAALILWVSYRFFPRKTIHVCVVDPGVGTSRKAILIVTRNYYFIGPDNGCLYPVAKSDGIEEVYDISDSAYGLERVSETFHGRDLFAPIAAYLSAGVPLEQLGKRYQGELVKSWIWFAEKDGNCFNARAIYIDGFGNIMMNIPSEFIRDWVLGSRIKITYSRGVIECPFVKSFGYVREGEYACYINSWGFLEIGLNRGSAAMETGIVKKEVLRVCKIE